MGARGSGELRVERKGRHAAVFAVLVQTIEQIPLTLRLLACDGTAVACLVRITAQTRRMCRRGLWTWCLGGGRGWRGGRRLQARVGRIAKVLGRLLGLNVAAAAQACHQQEERYRAQRYVSPRYWSNMIRAPLQCIHTLHAP